MSKQEANPGGLDYSGLMTRPKRLAIVALGPSAQGFSRRQMSDVGVKKPYDEVWTLNRGMRGFHHDKLFVMDDLRWIEKYRSKAYAEYLKAHDKTIITSTAYPEFPTAIPYPLKEVVDFHDDDIFAVNTVSYMVAYALYIGVEEMHVYGADFVYKNGVQVEEGGLAVAYMLGRCKMHGCIHVLTNETTMLYANRVVQREDGSIGRNPYGWHRIKEMADLDAEKKGMEQQRKKSLKQMEALQTGRNPSGEI
jgi:hypothetical protein